MKSTLFIPKTLKIGFQKRSDTFTGKLAYVIYYDEKGKLRKETSWESWRDKKIDVLEIPNVPTSGYVLNKGVRRYSDWGSGRSIVRIHDPREFEFEISVDNLIGILSHSDVSSGDISEKCVFAWYGTELVLLPCNSEAYTESVKFTAKQDTKVSTKELVKGAVYTKKKDPNKQYVYIGFFPWYESEVLVLDKDGNILGDRNALRNIDSSDKNYYAQYLTGRKVTKLKGNKHVFYPVRKEGTYYGHSDEFELVSPSTLAAPENTECVDNYAELVEKFQSSPNASRPVSIEIVPIYEYTETVDKRYNMDAVSIEGNLLFTVSNAYDINCPEDNYYYNVYNRLERLEYHFSSEFNIVGGTLVFDVQNKQQTSSGWYSRKYWQPVDRIPSIKLSPFLLKDSGAYEEKGKVVDKKKASDALFAQGFGVAKITLENGKSYLTDKFSRYSYHGY